MSISNALILAAGRGTRMKELTADRPKPMVPVLGKPALEHILLGLQAAGVGGFVIVTGYRAPVLEGYFGDGSKWGVRIRYLRQVAQDGNARAIQLARKSMGVAPFFLTFGDIMVRPDNYVRLARRFLETPADLQLSVVELEDVSKGSSVIFDESGRVEDIEEKPEPGRERSRWNSAAVFLARPVLFDYTGSVRPSKRGEYELTDAIRAMARDPARLVRAEKIEGYWGDLADAQELARMESLLKGA